ncbi:hypothetical protein [Gordonia sp. CPCC 205333]|uniref:hypothetical protein n=1 Tax=Gordonia sp. CPCC 205333 TaxID=3140790 RepID=UPI003AF39617
MVATTKRMVVAVLAAVALAVGMLAGTGQAAAATPGELQIRGGVECHFGQPGQPWNNFWYQYRWMTVVNVGGSTMYNVTLQEVGGATRFAKSIKPGQSMSTYNTKTKRWQRPIETRWFGCIPTSISGYTWGATIDNVLDNFGYWRSDIQRPGK